mmetsp:Transcript_8483/g.24383  ORF Transcript_8483/g.24383 Transcript_8483/m.24383 type:complete len:220 (+) Transcript_8483:846-1505(+)
MSAFENLTGIGSSCPCERTLLAFVFCVAPPEPRENTPHRGRVLRTPSSDRNLPMSFIVAALNLPLLFLPITSSSCQRFHSLPPDANAEQSSCDLPLHLEGAKVLAKVPSDEKAAGSKPKKPALLGRAPHAGPTEWNAFSPRRPGDLPHIGAMSASIAPLMLLSPAPEVLSAPTSSGEHPLTLSCHPLPLIPPSSAPAPWLSWSCFAMAVCSVRSPGGPR